MNDQSIDQPMDHSIRIDISLESLNYDWQKQEER
jgi:hypothetical protein